MRRDAVRRRRIAVAGVFTVMALAALASGAAVGSAGKASRPVFSASRTLTISCRSAALGGRLPAVVYLPAGYPNRSSHYRVVYFLHGLPAGPETYTTNAFVAASLSARQPAIVVAPQGARGSDSDREYLDWDAAEDWPQAIAHDLPRCIDRRFRTIANRFGRALIGLSAGGYGAFNIGLRNLSVFAAVESWSGYFAATDPSGTHVLDLGSPKANSDARVPSGADLKAEVRTWPSLIAFYVGNQDSRFLDMNRQFDTELTASRVGHLFRVYSGGHSSALWYSQARGWLGMALTYLSAEAHKRGGTAAARTVSRGAARPA
jgi:enterochelin esterase-like enzyme